jgi:hypothetical protein
MGIMQCHKHGPQPIGEACEECVLEEEYYTAKRTGRPLPFVGYERTLDWRSISVVEDLEAFLRNHYSFQKSRYPHSGGADSLVILPGTFTEPLTIFIYYVTNLKEQDYLLNVIQDFFSEKDYPQRRVKFFEEERWHIEKRGNSSAYWQLDAPLLREEITI